MKLHDRLRDTELKLKKPNVALDVYIISTTSMEALRNEGWTQSAEEWAANHVLFQLTQNYLQSIFSVES
ncbi:hypothetical protein D4R75_06110 [bacterium]|nr:MAG: hypothetical protein D4R75_06110 [bacterium]